MLEEPREKLDARAVKAWLYSGLLWGAALMIIPVAYILGAFFIWELPFIWAGWAGIIIVLSGTLVGAIIVPRLRMRYWRYEIREDEIDIQHGIIIIKRTLVPMLRVQHVDTERGPVMRHFGLATLRISTAATEHRIPALALEKAGELQGEISKLARVSDEDV